MIGSEAGEPFTADQTHGLAFRRENRLIAHSGELGWRSMYASMYEDAAPTGSYPGVPDPQIIYHVSRPASISRALGGEWETRSCRPRHLTLTPCHVPSEWIVNDLPEVAHVYIRAATLQRFMAELDLDAARVELIPRFDVLDPLLEQLALSILHAMRERPLGHALYVDCLAQAVAAHLVQHHSTLARPPRAPAPDGLVDHRLRRVAEYVEANLNNDLGLEAIAEVSGLSAFYLARTFRTAFGEPPHRYVVRRRIERAKELLRATDLPLAQIALACGFAHQGHLGQAFKRSVGVSPGVYRRERLP